MWFSVPGDDTRSELLTPDSGHRRASLSRLQDMTESFEFPSKGRQLRIILKKPPPRARTILGRLLKTRSPLLCAANIFPASLAAEGALRRLHGFAYAKLAARLSSFPVQAMCSSTVARVRVRIVVNWGSAGYACFPCQQ